MSDKLIDFDDPRWKALDAFLEREAEEAAREDMFQGNVAGEHEA